MAFHYIILILNLETLRSIRKSECGLGLEKYENPCLMCFLSNNHGDRTEGKWGDIIEQANKGNTFYTSSRIFVA
jgi:hypothetical protein